MNNRQQSTFGRRGQSSGARDQSTGTRGQSSGYKGQAAGSKGRDFSSATSARSDERGSEGRGRRSFPARGKSNGGRPDREQGGRRDTRRDGRGGAKREERAEAAPMEYIVGRRAILEAIKSNRPINKVLVQDGLINSSLGDIIAQVKAQGAFVQTVSRAKLDELSNKATHQGLLAYIAAKEYVELSDIIARSKAKKNAPILLLDGIVDPMNFGAILRSADGAGAAGVIIPKRRAVPLTGTVAKASAGAIEHVPVARVANLSQAIAELKEHGYWVVGADASAKENYWQMDLTGPIVFVIGSEGSGMGRLVAEHCDFLVKLPMRGELNSLNAGVAAAVLLYDAVRQKSN